LSAETKTLPFAEPIRRLCGQRQHNFEETHQALTTWKFKWNNRTKTQPPKTLLALTRMPGVP
jgi:hypothetical protein